MNFPRFKADDIVTGDFLASLCDVKVEPMVGWEQKLLSIQPGLHTVFVQPHKLGDVVPVLEAHRNRKFIVVSHNSDGNIVYEGQQAHHPADPPGQNCDYQWKPIPNILQWYCQNVNVTEPTVEPVPIGFENDYIGISKAKRETADRALAGAQNPRVDKMFVCHNEGTNPGQRVEAYRRYRWCPWADTIDGYNNSVLMNQFFTGLGRNKFVLSPEGNGLDTIRTWEALFMGCIPIVFRRPFTEWFAARLPIIVIDSYDQLSLEFLQERAAELENRNFSWGLLTKEYWKQEIEKRKTSC